MFQLDASNQSEYSDMFTNLNSMMETLSQQLSKSFRKSVKYQQSEPNKKPKVKSKISTLAVIFGQNKKSIRSIKLTSKQTEKNW